MSAPIGLPPFSQIKTEGYTSHLEALLKSHMEHINTLLKTNHTYTWENLMYPLEDLDDALDRLWSPLSHLHGVMDSKPLRVCYESCLPLLSAYETAVGHNHELYEAIKSIDRQTLDYAQNKIIEDNLLDFELSGVALSKEKKKRFEYIQTRLTELSNQFQNNVLDAAQAFSLHITDSKRLTGLPNHAMETAKELAEEKGLAGHILNLESPCFQAVITYAEDRALREEFYHAYITRASDQGPSAGIFDNTDLITEIMALRHEHAELLGYKNYAELSLATKMAESTTQVIDFMNDLVTRARPQAKGEFKELEQFATEHCHITPLKPWDVSFVTEKRRHHLFSLSQEDLRPYFQQPKVMDGLFALVKKLYGMTIEEIKGADVWHKDVQCYC
ncbi:MAG: M3 family metallopeptidase, partial [Legionellales bacterium]